MSRKSVVLIVAVLFCLTGICSMSYAVDAEKPQPVNPAVQKTTAMPAIPPNVGMLGGTIEQIDSADPANIKIQVKDDASGASRTVSITPYTNITKITDASELKTGDAIRVMVRKAEDKDVAMGILFGKIKSLPPMRPMPVTPPAEPIKK